jgi:hypothetical protein
MEIMNEHLESCRIDFDSLHVSEERTEGCSVAADASSGVRDDTIGSNAVEIHDKVRNTGRCFHVGHAVLGNVVE